MAMADLLVLKQALLVGNPDSHTSLVHIHFQRVAMVALLAVGLLLLPQEKGELLV